MELKTTFCDPDLKIVLHWILLSRRATSIICCLSTSSFIGKSGLVVSLLSGRTNLTSGDFNWGDKSDVDGSELVSYAVSINSPFIFISVNFRLSFLGFPGGAEAGRHNAHNLGLKDQRLALQWVRDYIKGFGGDKDKVNSASHRSSTLLTFIRLY
jgi:hypothetical protein